jgi:hypothetical protein
MNHYKKKAVIRVLSGIILFGIVELAVIKWLLPAYYTHYLILIPVYFLIASIGMLFAFEKMNRKKVHPAREITQLLMLSVVPMILSFALIFCYFYFIQIQKLTMLLAFSIFYLFFMFLKFKMYLVWINSQKQ